MKKILLFILSSSLLFMSCTTTKSNVASPINTESIKNTTTKSGYWQQHVDYKMDIDMNVNTYQYEGKQTLVYTNNSPDVLNKVFYHLYFNAFQPGSEMDARVQSISDPDGRMAKNIGTKSSPVYESLITKLQPNEIGYIKVSSLKQNGKTVTHKTVGTVLEVTLNKPIQPGEKVTFDMLFDAQVPIQIRRSGRNNKEGVALSMAQWYPKLAEYDFEGWHADAYIAREFHGVWGNFDIKLTIDKDYVVGGTGYLQGDPIVKGSKKTLHFKAPNVHDFTWAADPDYIHDTLQVLDGPLLNFYYKKTMPQEKLDNWKNLQPIAAEFIKYYSKHVGKYPYKQYSVIQGGDGGMEYAMCTLILGEGTMDGLIGVTAHEMAHSWFQFLLATNEAKHEWMDEGFATYIEYNALNKIKNQGKKNPLNRVYEATIFLAKSDGNQPQTTHADRYEINRVYSLNAYYKGAVFIGQLNYIIGEENLKNTLKQYFDEWSFKHPTPNDFIRVAEKVSGLELDWYLTDWTQTTNTIDYAVKNVNGNSITLERIGLMPMPIDLKVTYTDGTSENFYIPLREMRGEKPSSATLKEDWAWAFPTYTFDVKKAVNSVVIDPKNLMADINRDNNTK